MRIEFPFVEEKANIVPTILRPLARVKLINENMKTTVDMYVDSGADITLIPYSVGIALGFSLKPEDEIKRIGGVGGGKISIVVRRVKMRIGGEESNVRVAWCMSEDVPLILGRLDIFNKFNILFEDGKKTVFLK
jgi:hypothetical protein